MNIVALIAINLAGYGGYNVDEVYEMVSACLSPMGSILPGILCAVHVMRMLERHPKGNDLGIFAVCSVMSLAVALSVVVL